MLNSYDIGFDPGNSETCVVVTSLTGEQTALAFPSFVSRGSFSELKRYRSMAGQGEVAPLSESARTWRLSKEKSVKNRKMRL